MRYLLHDVFNDTVKNFPEKIAIREEDGRVFTYGELNALTNKFARGFLIYKTDVVENPFVGILSSVHAHSIAAVLGVLKIGCAYIPLDEFSPTERLMTILNSTKLDVLVVDPALYEAHRDLFSHPALKKIIFLDEFSTNMQVRDDILLFNDLKDEILDDTPQLNQVSDDLAYILHTSGSTGIPKGIMLTHRNARTFVDWMHKEFCLSPEDIVISRAPFKFDLSVFDIFNTFKAGATLVCYNWNRKRAQEEKHKDYVKLMVRERVTILYTTPSTFITLMNHGGLNGAELALTRIMYAGEPFPVAQLRQLLKYLPNVRIANIYGPTETNIITCYWINELPDDDKSIPLGKVVDDTEIIVVSEDDERLCNVNEIGELWCRGGTVTLGYLGMDDKTRQHLVKSPFHKYPVFYWRTGDYGYRDEDAILHYRGRRDHMVKINGYRIEIGEIEVALSQYIGIDELAVVVLAEEDKGNKLYCYYSILYGCKVSERDLREFLLTKIPKYMVPSRFIYMEVMPKTSSGKIDRIELIAISINSVVVDG